MAKGTGQGARATGKAPGVACWCGNSAMDSFNADYGVCRSCGTLVLLREDPPGRKPVVVNDENDFYGKKYWLQHQEGDLGNPDIHARARHDLAERNLHWLAAVLRHKLPGGRTLELGCGNGSFVALMKLAGYNASGSEMSPWVVEFGRRTFGADIRVGPVESLDIAPASLDAVLMMDVLEHLPDPVGTLKRCVKLLKKDGVLFIQTPEYREGSTHARMLESRDSFLEQLKPDEHLYLFTAASVARLLQEAGAPHVAFEPAIFAHYDMFVVASRAGPVRNTEAAIEAALLATPGGRVVLAMLDLAAREAALRANLAKARSDVDFLKGRVEELDRSGEGDRKEIAATLERLDAIRNERNLLEAQLADLRGNFDGAEADRVARGRVIEEQGQTISNLQAKVHEHLLELSALTEKHSVLLADQAQAEARMNELRRDYSTVVEDRAGRGKVIDEHARTISTLQVQIDTRLQEISALRHQVEHIAEERRSLEGQLAEARRQFDLVEADRVARGEVIEQQGRRAVELEALVDATQKDRDLHKAEAQRLDGELAAARSSLAASEERHRGNEARWWFRLGRRLRLL